MLFTGLFKPLYAYCKQVVFKCRIIVYIILLCWERCYKILFCEDIPITFYVSATKNRSNDFRRSLTFILALACTKYFVSLNRIYDESIIETSLDTVIDLSFASDLGRQL